MKLKINYLLNSGFLLDFGDTLIAFDTFDDPAGVIDRRIAKDFNKLYFFSTHIHFDHFNGYFLGHYKDVATNYILSDDIKSSPTLRHIPADKIHWLSTYDFLELGDKSERILVNSYDSTDAGTSFQVEIAGLNIYHAGDYNWWDWLGDTKENRKMAENAFHKQLKRFASKSFDVVFFPVDGRLEEAMEKGVIDFCNEVAVKYLVTMHSVSYPEWEPSDDFKQMVKNKPRSIWSPRLAGTEREYNFEY